MKRQRGRNRNGGGGKPQQNANRAFDSNGPEGIKVRGNAQHVFEKYQQLARDAATSGDRVLAENYLQHAEHYFRLIRALQPQRAPSDIIGRDNIQSGFDIDFEDESGAQAAAMIQEEPAQYEGQGAGGEQRRDDRDRRDRFEGRQRDDRQQRDDRPRDDRQRDDRPRDDRPRDDRPREDRFRDRDDRPRDRDRFRDRDERRPREERDPLAVVEPEGGPLPRGEESARLRSADGDESHAPAFLQSRAPVSAAPSEGDAEPAPKPRRGRRPRAETPASEEA